MISSDQLGPEIVLRRRLRTWIEPDQIVKAVAAELHVSPKDMTIEGSSEKEAAEDESLRKLTERLKLQAKT